jgi:uncharacterized lipoprotein YddW (UPF0748 family)
MNVLKTLSISILIVGSAVFIQSCKKSAEKVTAEVTDAKMPKGNGFYVVPDMKSNEEVKEFIDLCKKLKVNKIMVETKNTNGRLLYPSKKFPTEKEMGDFDCYGAICKAAKEARIDVHAWFVIFHEGYKDPVPIIKEHPEYLLVHRNGKTSLEQPTWSTVDPKYSSYWVCPTAKGYRDYLKDMMQEVIDLYDVDGIHLDYIRYPEEVDAREYCYCDRCKALFKENYGYTLPVNDVIKNRYWVTQMCDNVTNAVKDFADFAHKRNKLISAYVFTDYTTGVEAIYQNWPWFSHYLDFIIPTSYEVSPSYIHVLAKRTKAVIDKNCMLFPTVYAAPHVRRSEDGGKRWYNGKPEDVVNTFNAWMEEDVDGVVFFTYGMMTGSKTLTDEQRQKNIDKISEISRKYYSK